MAHERDHAKSQPVGRKIAGHESRQDSQGSSAFLRRCDDFFDVGRFGGSEDLDQFGNDRARQGSAGDDGSQLPPQRSVTESGDHQVRDDEGQDDGNDGRDPYQRGQWRLKVHFVGVRVFRAGDGAIEEVRTGARDQHGHAHDEDPYQQLHLGRRDP